MTVITFTVNHVMLTKMYLNLTKNTLYFSFLIIFLTELDIP